MVLDGSLDCGTGDPSIAALAGGGFVVAWSDGVRLSTRRLDAAGQPVGPATVVVQGHPSEPEAVALATGGYALVWWDSTRARVLARFFDSSGIAPSSEIEVGAPGAGPDSGFGGLDVAASAEGTLVVVWTNSESIWLRELRPDGTAPSPPFLVYDYFQQYGFGGGFFSPRVIVAPGGTFRVFWVASGWADPQRRGQIMGRRLVHDSVRGFLNTRVLDRFTYGADLAPASAPDGSYLLAWRSIADPYLDPPPPEAENPPVVSQLFDAADEPRGEEQHLDDGGLLPAGAVAVAAAPNGGFTVAWQVDLPTGTDGVTTAFARELDAGGVPRAAPQRIAPDDSLGQARPELAYGADGRLVATWQELDDPSLVFIVCPGEHVRERTFALGCGAGAACLRDDRFELTLTWADPRRGLAGVGHPVALTGETAYFWFFAPDAVEVIVKVLDGRALNGHYWVFWGGWSDLGLRLTVRDTATGATRTYETEPGTMVSAADTGALPQEAPGAQVVASAQALAKTAHAPSAEGEASAPVSAQPLRSFALDREAFAGDELDIETMEVHDRAFAASLARAAPNATAAPTRAASLADTAPAPCSPNELPVLPRPGLCLADRRFEVEATWRDFAGHSGVGEGVALGDDSGWFSFFGRDNVELVVKVLDGRAVNGRFWVFYGALTNVEYDLVVRNAATGATWTHHNPSGGFASGADVNALPP